MLILPTLFAVTFRCKTRCISILGKWAFPQRRQYLLGMGAFCVPDGPPVTHRQKLKFPHENAHAWTRVDTTYCPTSGIQKAGTTLLRAKRTCQSNGEHKKSAEVSLDPQWSVLQHLSKEYAQVKNTVLCHQQSDHQNYEFLSQTWWHMPAWSSQWVPRLPKLHSETTLRKQKIKLAENEFSLCLCPSYQFIKDLGNLRQTVKRELGQKMRDASQYSAVSLTKHFRNAGAVRDTTLSARSWQDHLFLFGWQETTLSMNMTLWGCYGERSSSTQKSVWNEQMVTRQHTHFLLLKQP